MRYVFRDVEIDEESLVVRKNGLLAHLEPRLFELLAYLVRNRQRVVTKAELIDQVWRGDHVGESVITRGVCIVRGVLECRGAIRTVYGRGYQWAAQVSVRPTDQP
jgi:DNA-binding winged helix-turn-helix (wHTH) protein